VCGGPCGVLACEIKEEGSLGLSDRLRERERVGIDPVFVTSSTGTRFFGPNLGKTNHRVHSLDFHFICFPLSPELVFSSNANSSL
jgi:hypothetical protein